MTSSSRLKSGVSNKETKKRKIEELTEETHQDRKIEKIKKRLNQLSKPVEIAQELESLVDKLYYSGDKINMDVRIKFYKISSKVRNILRGELN